MDSTRAARAAARFYRFAVFCGVTPLAFGAILFLAWLMARDFGLVLLSILAAQVMMLMASAGLLALIGYLFATQLDQQARDLRFRSSFVVVLLLLSINFFAAAGIVDMNERIDTHLRVEIRNESKEVLQEATLRLRDSAHPVGTIAPGGVAKAALPLRIPVETLTFEAVSDSAVHEALLTNYVIREDALTARFVVTVHDDGATTLSMRPTGPVHTLLARHSQRDTVFADTER